MTTLHLVDRILLPVGQGLNVMGARPMTSAVCGACPVPKDRRVITNNFRAGSYRVAEGQELCPLCLGIERKRARRKR